RPLFLAEPLAVEHPLAQLAGPLEVDRAVLTGQCRPAEDAQGHQAGGQPGECLAPDVNDTVVHGTAPGGLSTRHLLGEFSPTASAIIRGGRGRASVRNRTGQRSSVRWPWRRPP